MKYAVYLIILLALSPTFLGAQAVYFDWMPTDTVFVSPGAEFDLVVRVSGFQDAGAFQLSLGWDGNELDFLTLEPIGLSDMVVNSSLEQVSVIWYDASGLGQSRPDSTPILRLRFRALNTTVPIATQVQFTETPLALEFYRLVGQTLVSWPVTSSDKTIVIRDCELSVTWPATTAFCTGDSLLLAPSCVGCFGTFQWDNGELATTQWVSAPGWIGLSAAGALRCSIRDSIWVRELPLPIIDLPEEEVLCQGEFIQLSPTTVNNNYTYQWSEGSATAGINVDAPGYYRLHVLTEDGCQGQDTVWVREVPVLMGELVADADTVCLGSPVSLTFVGGMTPLWQDTTGRLALLSPNTAMLSPFADTRIHVSHENECFAETLELLIYVREVTLEVSADTSVTLGQTIFLSAAGGRQYNWSGPGISGASTGARVRVTPIESAWYRIVATDSFGCLAQDSVWVAVSHPASAYAPNAFSPNGDGINDYFTLFGSYDLVEVEYLAIYDRWGQLVFEKRRFPPNIPSEGWNGQFKDEDQDQGTLVFFAELRFSDDQKEIMKGEVILLR